MDDDQVNLEEIADSKRRREAARQPVAHAAAAHATDHASANTAKPTLVPIVSSTKPATGCMNA